MSGSGKGRSEVCGGGGGGSGGGDDDDDDGAEDVIEKKQTADVCEECGKKGQKAALFRFRKVKRKFQRKKNRVSGSGGGGGRVCYFCLRQPPTLDSTGVSQISDPNSPEFTIDMLRGLIENNDFYSKECNAHLDLHCSCSSCKTDKQKKQH